MRTIKNGYGFVALDDGSTMFVLPQSCAGSFEGELPPLGTRVRFVVVASAKTGRQMADNVMPAKVHPKGEIPWTAKKWTPKI